MLYFLEAIKKYFNSMFVLILSAIGLDHTALMQPITRRAPITVLAVCYAAAAGSSIPVTAWSRSAIGMPRAAATRATVSVWSLRVHKAAIPLIAREKIENRKIEPTYE